MFDFFQNQKNNKELIGMAESIEHRFESYIDNNPNLQRIDEVMRRIGYLSNEENNETLYHDNITPYDGLDGAVDSLPHNLGPEDIRIDDEYNYSERKMLRWIIRVLDEFEYDLMRDKEFSIVYLDNVRSFLGQVVETITLNDESYEKDITEVRNIIRLWIDYYTNRVPLTAFCFYYLHQTVHQAKNLLELYQIDAEDKVRTQKRLFEIGLKRLRMNDVQYIGVLFSLTNRFSKYIKQPYLHLRSLLYLYHSIICWIDNPDKEKRIRGDLYEGVQYAEYAYPDKRGNQNNGHPLTVLSPYKIKYSKYNCDVDGEFELQGEFKGFVGVKGVYTHHQEIIIGFSGTECRINWGTDISQFFGNLPISYIEALGLVESVWKSTRNRKGYINPSIKVYGHSLGGGLMQFAVSNCSTNKVTGYGYNSAGISNMNIINNIANFDREIYHLYKPNDIVFKFPGTHQLGYAIECIEEVEYCKKAHELDSIREEIIKCGCDHYVVLK